MLTAGGPYEGDAAEYLAKADRLLDDGAFDGDYRTPGYVLFVAALRLLPGSNGVAVEVAQHLIGVGVVAATVVVGARFFTLPAGIAAGLLAAVTPVMLGIEDAVLPDFLFGVALMAGAVVMARAASRPDARLEELIAAGAIFALAAYIKPAAVVAPAGIALGLLLSTRSLRRAVIGGGVVGITVALLVAPWVVRNQVHTGHATLSIQGGHTLFKRLFDIDNRPVPTDTAEGRKVEALQKRLVAERGPDAQLVFFVYDELRAEGLSEYEAISLQGRVAKRAIREAPLTYAGNTVGRVERALTDVNDFSREDLESEAGTSLAEGSGLRSAAVDLGVAVARVLSSVWWILSLNALAGLLLLLSPSRRVRAAAGIFLGLWLAISVATAASHGGLRRYSAQLAPLIWLFGAAGAAAVVAGIRATLERRRGTASESAR